MFVLLLSSFMMAFTPTTTTMTLAYNTGTPIMTTPITITTSSTSSSSSSTMAFTTRIQQLQRRPYDFRNRRISSSLSLSLSVSHQQHRRHRLLSHLLSSTIAPMIEINVASSSSDDDDNDANDKEKEKSSTALPSSSSSVDSSSFSSVTDVQSSTPTTRATSSSSSQIQTKTGIKQKSSTPSRKSRAQLLSMSIFNLIKACVGSGVLSLPYGLACISDQASVKKTLLPGSALVLLLGIFSGYTFHLIGRICNDIRNNSNDRDCSSSYKSLGDVWEYVYGSGSDAVVNGSSSSSLKKKNSNSSWIISACCFFVALGCTVSYSILLGDVISSLVQSVIPSMSTGSPLLLSDISIIGITLMTILPLVSLPSLASLAPMSLVGVSGVIISIIFMAIRGLMPNGPYALPNGSFISTLSKQYVPSFSINPTKNLSSSIKSSLILTSMLAISYVVHALAPDYFNSVSAGNNNNENNKETTTSSSNDDNDTSSSFSSLSTSSSSSSSSDTSTSKSTSTKSNNNTIMKNFTWLTIIGFGGTALINTLIMILGFITFGGSCSDIVLNNYSIYDKGATLCRMLFCISVIGSYPLMIEPMKNSIMTTFFNNKNKDNKKNNKLELNIKRSLLLVSTLTSLLVKNAGFVVSFTGAIMGSAVIYIFPTLMYLKHTRNKEIEMEVFKGNNINGYSKKSSSNSNNNKSNKILSFLKSKSKRIERYFVKFVLCFGIVASIVGGIVSVLNAYFPRYLL